MTAANHDLEAAWVSNEQPNHPSPYTVVWEWRRFPGDEPSRCYVPNAVVEAVRANERRASEERERVLREAAQWVTDTYDGDGPDIGDDMPQAMNALRRALLNPEDAGDKDECAADDLARGSQRAARHPRRGPQAEW